MIFHITTEAQWVAARKRGAYEADSLATDGFIHCSDEHQVARVGNAGFRGRTGLVVLHIDEQRVNADVRYENLEGGEETFPHLYGPLPVDAVIAVSPFIAGPNGDFTFPESTRD